MFSGRSFTKELLDADHIPQADLFRNLKELEWINRLLGGHAVTLKGLQGLNLSKEKTYKVLDIGSGGGDTLKAIAGWARKQGYQFELTGVDLKSDCINYATAYCKEYPEINFVQADYRHLPDMNLQYDIIITSLFCHHLTDEELIELLNWAGKQASTAFVMNDLHRHFLAYYSISLLTYLFSKSYLVKNDARLSVLRGFKKQELANLISKAQLNHQHIKLKWCWAFRWLLVLKRTE